MEEFIKQYDIKIPVYVSERVKLEKNNLFANSSATLLQHVKDIIANYNSNPQKKVLTAKRNKTDKIGIKSINAIDISFNTDDCLLLQVTAYKTNLLDGYYQDGEEKQQINFQQLDKLCSDTYFYVLYPLIRRNHNSNEDEVYWQLFIYEDPSKSDEEMVQIGRSMMRHILKTPIKNIKSEKLIEDLKAHKLADVEIVLSSFDEDDSSDGKPVYVKDYQYSCKFKREKKISLSGMRIQDVLEIYNDRTDFDTSNYTKRQLKFLTEDRHTYSIVQEYKDKIKEAIEDSFNYKESVSEEDVKSKKIFEVDEIRKHMEGVFCNYLANQKI